MNQVVICTGANGQDASYLIEKHLNLGDTVIGVEIWSPTDSYINIHHILHHKNFKLETGDITEKGFIHKLITKYNPDIIYNTAANSFVKESFYIPDRVLNINTLGVLNLLEAIRNYSPKTKFLQCSSSEQFGKPVEVPQTLKTPMIPNSPYGISKLASYHLVRLYREAYGIYAVNSVCFNHESERRGPSFVTRKITLGVADIISGATDCITLGNLDSKRDWGYADEYTDAMMLMLQQEKSDDYLISTGETHTIREFVEEAFKIAGMNITWEGTGLDEVGKDQYGEVRVRINKEFYRPAEVVLLVGDSSETYKKLGWKPKITFKELAKIMVEHDLRD